MAGARTRKAVTGRCCPDPNVDQAGQVGLVWTQHDVGPRRPCRICREGAFMRDCTGRPCHKTCAEAEATRDLRIAIAERTNAA